MIKPIPLLAVLLIFGAVARAEVYRCAGPDGSVQYRDTPCDSRMQSLRRLGEPETGTAAPDARMEKTQRLLEAMREERLQKQQLEAEARAEAQQQRSRCNRARDYLHNIERAGRVYDLDASGRRVYLPDDARERALGQARADVERLCR